MTDRPSLLLQICPANIENSARKPRKKRPSRPRKRDQHFGRRMMTLAPAGHCSWKTTSPSLHPPASCWIPGSRFDESSSFRMIPSDLYPDDTEDRRHGDCKHRLENLRAFDVEFGPSIVAFPDSAIPLKNSF